MIHKFKTISKKLLGDLHTPVSIYLKVRDMYPESALLESSDFHDKENSRSYIAICPIAGIDIKNAFIEDTVHTFLSRFEVTGEHKDICGLFGYTASGAVCYPQQVYILYKYVLVFDHFNNALTLVELVQEGGTSSLHEIETLIENRNFASYNFRTVSQTMQNGQCERRFKGDDFKVYRALRSLNPSPYLFYFDFGGFRIFGKGEVHKHDTSADCVGFIGLNGGLNQAIPARTCISRGNILYYQTDALKKAIDMAERLIN